jgi:hypothetical protein
VRSPKLVGSVGFRKLRQDWGELIAFWDRLGLKTQLLSAYPSPEEFWASGNSFLEIYKRLQKRRP